MSNRRIRRVLRKYDLPDLPEVRRMMRLAFWNGFTFGALEYQAARARAEGLKAIRMWSYEHDGGAGVP